jgi:hypothetical protein
MLDETYYSGRDVQRKLGITEPALRNLVQQGKIQKVSIFGRKQGVYLREDIDAFAEQWKKERSSPRRQNMHEHTSHAKTICRMLSADLSPSSAKALRHIVLMAYKSAESP